MKASDALVTIGLSREFGRRVALRDLSLKIRPGELYGFLGPNGAGKTTAIRCILGLVAIRWSGISGEHDPVQRLRNVGAMVETPAFHSFCPAEKIYRCLRRTQAWVSWILTVCWIMLG